MNIRNLSLTDAGKNTVPDFESSINAYFEANELKNSGRFSNNIFNCFDLSEEIEKFNFLTNKEKEMLLATEKENVARYKKIYQVIECIEDIYSTIFKGTESLQKRKIELSDKYENLWDRLYSESGNINFANITKFIENSTVLTNHEKKILLKNELEIQEIEKILGEKYDEMDRISKDLIIKVNIIYSEIQKNYDKNKCIWKKVIKNRVDI